MKAIRTILTMMMLVALYSCGEKKQAVQEQTDNGQKLIIHMNSAWAAVETS